MMSSSERYLLHHGLLLPNIAHTEESLRYARDFSVEDSDVLAVTYPKSGTTWMQEVLPLVLNGGDLTPVQTIPNWDRVPWLEETRLAIVAERLPTPRALVSHLPYHLMPKSLGSSKAKVIYVSRNPKDVMVSSYHFHKMASFLDDPGTFQEFMDTFLEGKVLFGKWTDHVKSWRHTELGDRILYLTYEEMVQDLRGSVRRVSDFLGRPLDEEAMERIAAQCCFNNMKTNCMSNYSLVPQDIMDNSKSPFLRKGNCMSNYSLVPQDIMDNSKSPFLRKGVTGDWRNHFSAEQEAQFSAVISREMEGEELSSLWAAPEDPSPPDHQ